MQGNIPIEAVTKLTVLKINDFCLSDEYRYISLFGQCKYICIFYTLYTIQVSKDCKGEARKGGGLERRLNAPLVM